MQINPEIVIAKMRERIGSIEQERATYEALVEQLLVENQELKSKSTEVPAAD